MGRQTAPVQEPQQGHHQPQAHDHGADGEKTDLFLMPRKFPLPPRCGVARHVLSLTQLFPGATFAALDFEKILESPLRVCRYLVQSPTYLGPVL